MSMGTYRHNLDVPACCIHQLTRLVESSCIAKHSQSLIDLVVLCTEQAGKSSFARLLQLPYSTFCTVSSGAAQCTMTSIPLNDWMSELIEQMTE